MTNSDKPRYHRVSELLGEVNRVIRRPDQIASLLTGRHVSSALRERLMLVVTGVNRCRYCAALHSRIARSCDVPAREVRALLDGATNNAPAEERPALEFAKAWAEGGGAASEEARQALQASYGAEAAAEIELALRLIRVGNLTGNAFDRLLHRVSGGLAGGARPAQD